MWTVEVSPPLRVGLGETGDDGWERVTPHVVVVTEQIAESPESLGFGASTGRQI